MRQSPKELEESARVVTRRGLVVGGLQLAFMGMLGLRMRQLQIEEADQFRLLAEENRVNMRLLAPPRGIIYDRNGVIIADNSQNYRIIIVREDAGDVDEVIARLKEIITLDEDELERALKEMYRRSPFVPVTLADRLSWEDFSKVAVNSPALPGITPDVGLSRYYPMKGDFAHVIGYVGPVSDYDLSKIEDPDPLLQIPKFQIGKVGVEAKLEEKLRGKAGNSRIEVNAAGRVMRELDRDPGTPGNDVQLTVDARLQNFVQARLAGESAAVVVMDCTNGDILALGSAPSFDPNKFVRGISSADYNVLREDRYIPLRNKTVQGTYPPGSTYKMIVALAALEAGVVSPGETVWCPGYYQLGRRRFHCWKRGGHGHMNLENSLVQSCDTYYYDISQRVGIDRISEMANKLGCGVRHDIPMSAVAEGLAPTQKWKQFRYEEPWRVGDTLNASIGQGYTLASPLHLAVYTARMASGLDLQPRLIKTLGGEEQGAGTPELLDISTSSLRLIRKAMYNVSNGSRGTARGSRIVEDGKELAGKTGTSQVRNITAAERARGVFRNEDLPWERRDHALFVGFAPFDAPKYAVSVVVEHGGGGSAAAAPVARDVLLFAQYGGVPPLEAYPSSQRERIKSMYEAMTLAEPEPPAPGRSRA
ncbi:penicillin-binding protein 2 [Ovoidimarina sediminis]|uniref:penicillin-binding protein 2 n=1 Tax=Ovoidimarina sediminis TaxID=3079856 RepID=UPI00290A4DB9|nr:penicillin-binding protein 2 [Rhodophyticola sp. MJ-SS7]MDU8945490.1 penicillin-binding protein 2 [Rhodophyticola sp. MJ-SS7]